MHEIGVHIERLLLEHDCVVIPEWGGFVLQSISASYNEKERLFFPRRKEIVFNATLRHNDGLLAESYMQMYKVDYRKAQLMIEEDVAKMKAALQEDKVLPLGELGSFGIGKEGQIVFHPGESAVLSASSYGLEPFGFPRLQQRNENKDTVYIPISRRFVRAAIASAAAVALFFMASTPVRDVEISSYTASLVPMEMARESIRATVPAAQDVAPVEMPAAVEVKDVKPAKTVEMTAPQPKRKTYHIVIGSFPAEREANKFLASISREGYAGAGVIARGGRHRVYAEKFDNREEAEIYLTSLRSKGKYKDAWLFICR